MKPQVGVNRKNNWNHHPDKSEVEVQFFSKASAGSSLGPLVSRWWNAPEHRLQVLLASLDQIRSNSKAANAMQDCHCSVVMVAFVVLNFSL